jgi:hypothetical protein
MLNKRFEQERLLLDERVVKGLTRAEKEIGFSRIYY